MPTSILNDADLALDRHDNIFIITLRKGPENRLDSAYCQKLMRTLHQIQNLLSKPSSNSSSPGGAVITRGNDTKYFCTGLDLHESDTNPFANTDGFYPLLATLLDFPYPTIALLTGHTFGGACPFALAHDYRIMNSRRGFISMPPVNLGLHFPGIGALPRLKLQPKVARKMLLEAHRWTGVGALEEGIVDAVAEPDQMLEVALEWARRWAPKAEMEVYGLLRNELYGEAAEQFRRISYVHGRRLDRPAIAKI